MQNAERRMKNLEKSVGDFPFLNSKFCVLRSAFAFRSLGFNLQPSAFCLSGHPLKTRKSLNSQFGMMPPLLLHSTR